jgi:hypothetical protein
MPQLRKVLIAILVVIASSAAAVADTVQKDPQNRFTITVPVGWRVTTTDESMKLTMGDTVITILHLDGQKTALTALQAGIAQTSEGFQGGQEMQHGEAMLGGEHALFANYSAIDDRSIEVYLRFVATDSGWVFFASATQNGFSALHDTLVRIERSFQLTPKAVATPPAAQPATPKE